MKASEIIPVIAKSTNIKIFSIMQHKFVWDGTQQHMSLFPDIVPDGEVSNIKANKNNIVISIFDD